MILMRSGSCYEGLSNVNIFDYSSLEEFYENEMEFIIKKLDFADCLCFAELQKQDKNKDKQFVKIEEECFNYIEFLSKKAPIGTSLINIVSTDDFENYNNLKIEEYEEDIFIFYRVTRIS